MGDIMKWTTDKPTVNGWYWHKSIKNGPPIIVEIVGSMSNIRLTMRFGDMDFKLSSANGVWSDQPIPEPEEA